MSVTQDEIVREAQTMRQQMHSNVLPLYTSFVHEQNLWMVMPYVSSGSVLNIMKYAHPDVRFRPMTFLPAPRAPLCCQSEEPCLVNMTEASFAQQYFTQCRCRG